MEMHPQDDPQQGKQTLTVERILESIIRLQSCYIDDQQPQLAHEQLLQEFLTLTGSASGFIDEVPASGDIKQLATRALINSIHISRSHQQAERELKESKERFEILVNGINDAIWDSDLPSGRHYVSSRWKEMLGYQDHELEFSIEEWEARLHPQERDEVLAWWSGVLGGADTAFKRKFQLRHRDGSYRHIYCRGILVRDHSGAVIRVAGMNSDVSVRIQYEADHKKLQHQLYQAQKMELVGKLAGGIAHDYNNLLNLIMTQADLALRALGHDSPQAEPLIEIRKAVERSAALTRRLLGFAKGQPLLPVELNVNDAIRDLLTLLQRLIGDNVRLDWHLESELVPVWMDRTEFDQIMTNLCVNASDTIGAKGVISIKSRNVVLDDMFQPRNVRASECEFVLISVSDNSKAMEQGLIPRLLESFFGSKPEVQGNGLGLATVYGIVKQHEGFIEVNSDDGRGTTFEIYLPRYRNSEPVVRQSHLKLVRNE